MHAGSAYELKSGDKVPFSILGALSPDLSLPYSPAQSFPFDNPIKVPTTSGSSRSRRPPMRAAALLSLLQDDISPAVPESVCPENANTAPSEASKPADMGASPASTQNASAALRKCRRILTAQRKTGAFTKPTAAPVRGSKGEVDCPRNAHFLAMCSKLIYEDERIVRDVIERRCAALYPYYSTARLSFVPSPCIFGVAFALFSGQSRATSCLGLAVLRLLTAQIQVQPGALFMMLDLHCTHGFI